MSGLNDQLTDGAAEPGVVRVQRGPTKALASMTPRSRASSAAADARLQEKEPNRK